MSQQINLFSPLLRKQKKYFSALTMVQALSLLLAGSLMFYAYLTYQVRTTARLEADLSRTLDNQQAILAKLSTETKNKQKNKQLESDVARLGQEIKGRQKILDTLQAGDFGNTKGFAEHLRAFSRQSVHGLWLTGFVINGAGDDTQISGRALQPELVPAYINRLKQEPVMRGKSFAVLEMGQPAEEASAKDKDKKAEQAHFIEFNLRSSEPDSKGAASK